MHNARRGDRAWLSWALQTQQLPVTPQKPRLIAFEKTARLNVTRFKASTHGFSPPPLEIARDDSVCPTLLKRLLPSSGTNRLYFRSELIKFTWLCALMSDTQPNRSTKKRVVNNLETTTGDSPPLPTCRDETLLYLPGLRVSLYVK